MLQNNELKYMLCQENDFINNIKKETVSAIKSGFFEKVFSLKNKINLYGYEYNGGVYIIVDNLLEEKISVYHDFIIKNKKKSDLKNILHYEIEKFKHGEFNIYKSLIFEVSKDENLKKYGIIVSEEMREKVLEKIKKTSTDDQLIKVMSDAYNVGTLICNDVNFCADCTAVKEYVDFIYSLNGTINIYNESFYIKNSQRVVEKCNIYLDEIMNNVKFLNKVSKMNSNDKENKYDFNDGDYFYWLENENLYIEDQNILYVVKFKEKDITIFYVLKEREGFEKNRKQLEENIKNENTSLIKDVAFKVENNSIKYANNALMYCFFIDLQGAVRVTEENQDGEREIKPPFSDVNYILDYFYNIYGMSKFNTLANVFLSKGGDIKYDDEKGEFYYKEMILMNMNVVKKEPTNEMLKDFHLMIYECALKKFDKLNDEWIIALSELRNYLENNNPSVIDHKKTIESGAAVFKKLDRKVIIEEIELYFKKYNK